MTAAATAVSLHPRTLASWLEATGVGVSVSLVPVEVIAAPAAPASFAVVSRSGYRLDGLTIDEPTHVLSRRR